MSEDQARSRSFGWKNAAKLTLHWVLSSAYHLAFGSREFYAITPPFMLEQRIWARSSGKTIRVSLRDMTDYLTMSQIYIYEDYRLQSLVRYPELLDRYRAILAEGKAPLIIDCGANIGLASKYFRLMFPDAKIIAIEPDPANHRQAVINCQGENIDVRQKAIGSICSRASMVDNGGGHNALQVVRDEGGDIEVVSIDSLLESLPAATHEPFIIKIDIEGFEAELFSANTGWFDRFPIAIVELHDWMLPRSANSRAFLQEVSRYDRDFIYIGENVFSISNRS